MLTWFVEGSEVPAKNDAATCTSGGCRMNIDRYGSLRDRGTTQIISGLSFVIGGE